MSQTLAVGKTVASQYSDLGFTGQSMAYDLGRMIGLLVGPQSSGKSSILQSNPDAYIFNLDLSSTVINPCRAMIWPGIHREGYPIDVDGKALALTHEKIREKILLLEEKAIKNKPRPATVCFDSITTWIQILKDYFVRVAREAQKKKGVIKTIEDFGDLDGRDAWDDIYESIISTVLHLRGLGYGVYITVHIIDKVVQLTEKIQEIMPKLSITDNFFGTRLGPLAELIVPCTVEWKSQETVTPKFVTVDGAQVKVGDDVKVTKVPKYFADFSSSRYAGIVKGRGMKDKIELRETEGWQTLEEAYNKVKS